MTVIVGSDLSDEALESYVIACERTITLHAGPGGLTQTDLSARYKPMRLLSDGAKFRICVLLLLRSTVSTVIGLTGRFRFFSRNEAPSSAFNISQIKKPTRESEVLQKALDQTEQALVTGKLAA